MGSFDDYFNNDGLGFDIDALMPESNEYQQTPTSIQEKDDALSQAGSPYDKHNEEEVKEEVDTDARLRSTVMEGIASLKNFQAFASPMRTRAAGRRRDHHSSPSERSTDSEDSQISVYRPSPTVTPCRRSASQKTPRKIAKVSTKNKKSPARSGEPRRQQNMKAQKKYRDKKVDAAKLMSETLVLLRSVSESNISKKSARIAPIIDSYRDKLGVLDPHLASKQDAAVLALLS